MRNFLIAAALASSVGGLFFAPAAVLGSALVVFALIIGALPPRARLPFGVGAGGLALLGLVRFIVVVAVPNIVGSGERTVEEKAVSRLRELRWAEEQTRARTQAFADLPALMAARDTPLPGAPFAAGPAPGVMRSEGYNFVVHARPDGFCAYAWSEVKVRRAFAIDERDQICEAHLDDFQRTPPDDAAFARGGACGSGSDGARWRLWSQRRRKLPAR